MSKLNLIKKLGIIWACKEGHEKEMSFNARQFSYIIRKDKDDLMKQIIDRTKVIL